MPHNLLSGFDLKAGLGGRSLPFAGLSNLQQKEQFFHGPCGISPRASPRSQVLPNVTEPATRKIRPLNISAAFSYCRPTAFLGPPAIKVICLDPLACFMLEKSLLGSPDVCALPTAKLALHGRVILNEPGLEWL